MKAIYAGSFDPITNGHLDIIERSLKVFDELIVAVGINHSRNTMFKLADRLKLIETAVMPFKSKVIVTSFEGLLVDYVRGAEAKIVVRGLRAVSDYEYEAQMATINGQLAPDIETVFFMTSAKHSFVSASIVREIARFGGDISALVPKGVREEIEGLLK
jgi:pantetheine-phosphate adenylyltransferase